MVDYLDEKSELKSFYKRFPKIEKKYFVSTNDCVGLLITN